MAVGNAGGGYANLEASPNYVGEAIKYNIDNGFRIRAEKRLDDKNKVDAEEKRVAREDKEVKEIALENKNFDITQSGVQGIDGKVLELVHKNQDQVNEFNKILYNPLSTKEAKINAQMQKGRIFDNLKQLSETNTNFKTILAGIQKGINDGTLDAESAKEALDRAKTLMGGNYHFDQNNEGLGTIDFYETDKDGRKVTDEKGNPKIKSSQTYTEFLSSLNPDRASTYAKDEQLSVKTYMPDKTVVGEGGRIISKAVVDTKKGSRDWERIGAFVDGYIDKPNERRILGRKLGIDPNNIEELRDKLILNYMAGTKNETSNLPDTSQQALEETKRENARKQAKEAEGNKVDLGISGRSEFTGMKFKDGVFVPQDKNDTDKLGYFEKGTHYFPIKGISLTEGGKTTPVTIVGTTISPNGKTVKFYKQTRYTLDKDGKTTDEPTTVELTVGKDNREINRLLSGTPLKNANNAVEYYRKAVGLPAKNQTTSTAKPTSSKKEYKAQTLKGSR